MTLDYKGESTGIREMRKHVTWYTAGYPGSAKLRRRIVKVEYGRVRSSSDEYQKDLKI